LHNLKLRSDDLFLDKHQLENQLVRAESPNDLLLEQEQVLLAQLAERIRLVAINTDTTLDLASRNLENSLKTQLNKFSEKLVRAQKRKSHDSLSRLHALLNHVFPNGSLQERTESVATFIHRHGFVILDHLIENIDPFENQFLTLEMKE
jgi:uncharacterized protein YllA (UPF0747 family)